MDLNEICVLFAWMDEVFEAKCVSTMHESLYCIVTEGMVQRLHIKRYGVGTSKFVM